MRRLALVVCIALGLGQAAKAAEFATPEEAVQSYITGVKTGSGTAVSAAFDETATIKYYNPQGIFRDFSAAAFAETVTSSGPWPEPSVKITAIVRTGDIARTTVEFTWGPDGEHRYIDYLNLINPGTGWRITNKVATYVDRSNPPTGEP